MRKRLALKILRAQASYSREQRLRAYRARHFGVGARVRVRDGEDAGRAGTVRRRSAMGTYGVLLDGERERMRFDGTLWFPLFDASSLGAL
jgi:hypothetical protein